MQSKKKNNQPVNSTFFQWIGKIPTYVAAIAVFLTGLTTIIAFTKPWVIDPEYENLVDDARKQINLAHAELGNIDPRANAIIEKIENVRNWDNDLTGNERCEKSRDIISLLLISFKDYIPGDSKSQLEDAQQKIIKSLENSEVSGIPIPMQTFRSRFESDYQDLIDGEIAAWRKIVQDVNLELNTASRFLEKRGTFKSFEDAHEIGATSLTRREGSVTEPPKLSRLCADIKSSIGSLNDYQTRHWWRISINRFLRD